MDKKSSSYASLIELKTMTNEDLEKKLSEVTQEEPREDGYKEYSAKLRELEKQARIIGKETIILEKEVNKKKEEERKKNRTQIQKIVKKGITYLKIATAVGVVLLAGITYYKLPDIKNHLKQIRIEGYHSNYLELKADYEEIREYRKYKGKGIVESCVLHAKKINKINKKVEELGTKIEQENSPELQQLYTQIKTLDKDMDNKAQDSMSWASPP